jgi:hypothetical protein
VEEADARHGARGYRAHARLGSAGTQCYIAAKVSLLEPPVRHPTTPGVAVDERAARRSLREQIGRLEHELVTVAASAYPRLRLPAAPRGHAGPRVLSLGELERTRDELAGQVAALRRTRAELCDRQAAKRLLVERMLLQPGHYKWVRVTNDDIGEPGCKTWHVRPRLGLVGMLAGWWHVKVSSGCPLAGGSRRRPRSRPRS